MNHVPFRSGASTLVLAAALLFPSPGSAAPYTLGAQDKLKVVIYEWPNVSGEYAVGADGKVTLPLIGVLAAGGLTPSALAETIGHRLTKTAGLAEAPATTVEVIGYRPFYILGEVQKPGEYAYRPGMTVLQAVSIAGGFPRPEGSNAFQAARDAMSAAGDARVVQQQMLALTARQARLQADLAGRATITPASAAAAGMADGAVMATLLRGQQRILDDERASLRRQLADMTAQQALYAQEITSIQHQIETEQRQLGAARQEVEAIHKLLAKGVASMPRALEYERAEADIEAKILELNTAVLRARQSMSDLEQKSRGLVADHATAATGALAEVAAQLAELETRRQADQHLASIGGLAGLAVPVEEREQQPPVYRIVRRSGAVFHETAVAENTAVAPGDVIKVVPAADPRALFPSAAVDARPNAQGLALRD